MGKPETRLTRRIQAAIEDRWSTAWVLKVHGGPFQTAGVPDLVGCIDSRTFGLEVKRQAPGESEQHARERVTVRQQTMLDRMAEAGAITGVVLTPEEALDILESTLTSTTT